MPSRRFLILGVMLGGTLVFGVLPVRGEDAPVSQPPCKGKYQGQHLASDELTKVLEDHKAWISEVQARKVEEYAPDERQANLCGADLQKANLKEANLTRANLTRADLTDTNLERANLTRAELHDANLTRANLFGANLTGAFLIDTNLTGAYLLLTNLTGATLERANLTKANLTGAKFQAVFFEPVSESLPVVSSAARARGLSEITFDSPFAAVEPREAFKKAGLREPQRQLTRAINYTQTPLPARKALLAGKQQQIGERLEAGFRWLMFEKTCEYGWFPGRPLRILGVLLLVFAIPYRIALSAKGPAGIWAIWSPDRVHKSEGQDKPVRVTNEFGFSRFAGTLWEHPIRELRSLWVALYFSLLSAFHLGWRELNVGTWISRIQPREYTLRATGWVRVVAGIQSLLSVYLVALWALTYFGSPFE